MEGDRGMILFLHNSTQTVEMVLRGIESGVWTKQGWLFQRTESVDMFYRYGGHTAFCVVKHEGLPSGKDLKAWFTWGKMLSPTSTAMHIYHRYVSQYELRLLKKRAERTKLFSDINEEA